MIRPVFYTILFCSFYLCGTHWTVYADSTFTFFASLVCVVALIDHTVFLRQKTYRINLAHILLLGVLLITVCVSLIRREGYGDSLTMLRYSAFWGLFLIFSQKNGPLELSQIIRVFAFCVLVLLGVWALGEFGGINFGWADLKLGSRLSLTFGNPNYLAAFSVLVFPLLAVTAFAKLREGNCSHWLYLSAAFACILFVFFSGSRNGLIWLSFSLVILFSFFYHTVHGRWVGRIHFIFILLVPLFMGLWFFTYGEGTWDKFLVLFDGGGKSEIGRFTVWLMSANTVTSSWDRLFFGSGFGALYPVSMMQPGQDLLVSLDATGFRFAHCEYLDIILEGGLVSIALFVGAVFFVVRSFVRKGESIGPKDEREKALRLGAILATVSILGFATFSVATRYTVILLTLAVLIGAFLRYFTSSSFELSRKKSTLLTVILAIASVGFVAESFRLFSSGTLLYEHRRLLDGYRLFHSGEFKDLDTDQLPSAIQRLESRSKRSIASEALDLVDRSVQVYPERAFSTYSRLAAMIEMGGEDAKNDIDQTYAELQELIPQYTNSSELYAFHLASSGRMVEASEVISKLADLRYYNLGYLSDLMFYSFASGDLPSYNRAARDLFFRAFNAELKRRETSLMSVRKEQSVVHVRYRRKSGEIQTNSYNAELFAGRIPLAVRLDRQALQQFTLAAIYEVMVKQVGLDEPSFVDLLPSDSREEILKLALGR